MFAISSQHPMRFIAAATAHHGQELAFWQPEGQIRSATFIGISSICVE